MLVFEQDGLNVFVPDIPTRVRPNCDKAWGQFVKDVSTKDMKLHEAMENGVTCGDFIEMALCFVAYQKRLTFQPHYIDEKFTEIWGIPVKGEIKAKFSDNASELITFLLHRQSADKLGKLSKESDTSAFIDWLDTDKEKDIEQFALERRFKTYSTKIFTFQLTLVNGVHGAYYFVATSMRDPETDIEKKALGIAEQFHLLFKEGTNYCIDQRIEENHAQTILAAEEFLREELPPAKSGKGRRKLKA